MSTLSFSELSKEDAGWIDELIGELVEQGVLQEFSCLRRLLTDLRFKGSSEQGCILLYFLTTLHTVLGYTESQDAINYYQILAEKYQSAFNTPATSNSDKFTHLMKACMKGNEDEYEGCKTEYIQQLISEDKFNDANIFIVQYRLYKQGIECYETRLEGLSPCKSEIETSTNIFKFRNSLFIKFLEYLDSGENTETIEDMLTQIRKVDCSPKGVVVVDAGCKRRYENGVFYVNDIKAGLQISQNGGRLLIKNGDYTADAWHDVKLLKDGATLEIIGESSSDCCLSGSIQILACSGGKISIRNVKLEIGDSAESKDAMNILGGWVNFDTCVLECFVNTAIYIHARPDGVLTAVNMKNCFIEGLQSCQRIFSIEQGVNTSLTLNSCYINETYSVLSWFNDKKAENVHVSISNCFINDIQDVLRVVLNEVSNVSVHLEKTSFNLVLYSEEESSTAITLPNLVDLQFSRNMTVLNHTQGVGVCISCSSVDKVSHGDLLMDRNIFFTEKTLDRRLSTSTCLILKKVKEVKLENNFISGFRLGVEMYGCRSMHLNHCDLQECSVGVHLPYTTSLHNIRIENTYFRSMFNGFLLEGRVDDFSGRTLFFSDVLEPGLTRPKTRGQLIQCCRTLSSDLLEYSAKEPDQDDSELNVGKLKMDLSLSDIPEQESDIPDHESNIPDQDSDIPVQDSDIPNQDSDIPDQDSDIPNQDSDIPDQESNIPDQDSDIPDQDSDIPDQDSDTRILTETINTSDDMRNTSEHCDNVSPISDAELKLFLMVAKNLPFQKSTEGTLITVRMNRD